MLCGSLQLQQVLCRSCVCDTVRCCPYGRLFGPVVPLPERERECDNSCSLRCHSPSLGCWALNCRQGVLLRSERPGTEPRFKAGFASATRSCYKPDCTGRRYLQACIEIAISMLFGYELLHFFRVIIEFVSQSHFVAT